MLFFIFLISQFENSFNCLKIYYFCVFKSGITSFFSFDIEKQKQRLTLNVIFFNSVVTFGCLAWTTA